MEIYSLSFLYLVLPLWVLLCAVLPPRRRPVALLALSCGLYYWHEGVAFWLLAGIILSDWLLAAFLGRERRLRIRRAVVLAAAVKDVGLFAGASILAQLGMISFPMGLGVCALSSLGYVIDCHHGFAQWERSPVPVALMSAFFPSLYAGPILSYSRAMPLLHAPRMTLERMGEGGGLFLRGMAQKVILGDSIGALLQELIHGIPIGETTSLGVWSMLVTLAFTLYFNLAGFCDMARGLAMLFGFDLPENFRNPFLSKSINEFFGRFNLTVNRFIRRHVYVVLGGAHGSSGSVIFNILLLSILMALWFGIRLNLVAWGIFLSLFVVMERYLMPRGWEKTAGLVRWLYSMAVLLISLVFFAGDSLTQSFTYLRIMFRVGGTADMNERVIYLLFSNYLILAVAFLCVSGFPRKLGEFLKARLPRTAALGGAVLNLLLLMAVTAFSV